MPRSRSSSDLTRISVQQLAGQTFDHLFEPLTWSTCIKTDYHLAPELTIKSSQLNSLGVLKHLPMDDSIGTIAITNCLLMRMKVYSDVYCHMGSPVGAH